MTHTSGEIWMMYTKKADFAAIADRFGIDPVTARILTNRGITGDTAIERYLRGTIRDLHDPALLPGAEKAATAEANPQQAAADGEIVFHATSTGAKRFWRARATSTEEGD